MKMQNKEMGFRKEIVMLRGEAVKRTRPLWEEVFDTDSQEFVDYYYETKAIHNICFVIEEQEQIIAMLHLTPYDICVKKDTVDKVHVTYKTFYIVGVATRKHNRHKGYMTQLLEAAFAYMRKINVLFTFLMPANPAIYQPFDFRYIYERTEYQMIREDKLPIRQEFVRIEDKLSIRIALCEDCKELADFSQKYLQQNYTFFLKRTEEYFQTLLAELASENGHIYMVYKESVLCGYFLYAREGQGFVQEVLLKDEAEALLFQEKNPFLLKEKRKKPIIMAKYLGADGQEDCLLKELASGKMSHGFMNEIV